MATPDKPTLNQLNVIVEDTKKAADFYRRLGLDVAADPDEHHVEINLPNGLSLELDRAGSVAMWDSGWTELESRVILGFALASRDEVDARYDELTSAGYRGRQRPYDAFWGARYAVVEDPDGNGVGLMSPTEPDRKFWPPKPPPS